ncbi:MAG: hypothetical protein ACREJD_02395 [Phycisphaerales bacterium]
MKVRCLRFALVGALLPLSGGCANYTTPGGPADFRALGITQSEADANTDAGIATKLARKPLASFPTSIATVRVQARGYRSYSLDGWGDGDFTVITVRDIETAEQLEKLSKLPMIREIVPINRMVITGQVRNERDLRDSAANLHADMVAVYTLDTKFGRSTTIPYLGVISLGLFPNEQATVTATASAVLIDTRNGYVYGAYEATSKKDRLTNAWSSQDAIDAARRDAESSAFDGLVDQFVEGWPRIVAAYAKQ